MIEFPTDELLTPGAIARLTGHSRHRVSYVISSLGIGPSRRAGLTRIFNRRSAARIVAELDRIEATRIPVRG